MRRVRRKLQQERVDMQVSRKRLFNTIQDMKGKIRVYCRVRPILDFEADKGQKTALQARRPCCPRCS